MNDKVEKLVKLLEDKDILAKFEGVSVTEAIEMLQEYDIEISKDELEELKAFADQEEAELELDSLEGVTGGKLIPDWYKRGFKATVRGFLAGLKFW